MNSTFLWLVAAAVMVLLSVGFAGYYWPNWTERVQRIGKRLVQWAAIACGIGFVAVLIGFATWRGSGGDLYPTSALWWSGLLLTVTGGVLLVLGLLAAALAALVMLPELVLGDIVRTLVAPTIDSVVAGRSGAGPTHFSDSDPTAAMAEAEPPWASAGWRSEYAADRHWMLVVTEAPGFAVATVSGALCLAMALILVGHSASGPYVVLFFAGAGIFWLVAGYYSLHKTLGELGCAPLWTCNGWLGLRSPRPTDAGGGFQTIGYPAARIARVRSRRRVIGRLLGYGSVEVWIYEQGRRGRVYQRQHWVDYVRMPREAVAMVLATLHTPGGGAARKVQGR